MRHREIDQVTRWYPTEFAPISGADIFRNEPIDMYIHIPFCKGKCAFCPFNSKPINKQNLGEYFDALKRELHMYADEPFFKYKSIRAIWIGGGTPSAVPFSYIQEVLDIVFTRFTVLENAEVTLETNLHDLTEDYIIGVSNTQINRLSIGVQSFTDKYLDMMGRSYSPEDISTFFSFIRKYNLTVSIDLMFRYPGQTLEEIDDEIQAIKRYNDCLDHITLYGLILFPRLGIYKRVAAGKLPKQASLSTYEKMSKKFGEKLAELGFHQYTSNHYAKDGKENVYNNDRWGFPQIECASFGPGAFGQLNGYVYCNEHSTEDYFAKINNGLKPIQMGKRINSLEQISRYLVLGVRCRDIDLIKFADMTGVDPRVFYKKEVDRLLEDGLIEVTDDVLHVTEKGCAYIVDVCTIFETENNKLFTQPQYTILDMFEGQQDSFYERVIEPDVD